MRDGSIPMDWQSKFYAIVRETDENLAKAKIKLTNNKSAELVSSQRELVSPRHAVRTEAFSQSLGSNQGLLGYQLGHPSLPHFFTSPVEELNMSAAGGIQVLHMQEQIDAQRRTIDQLQKLVKALDSERDFYKQQISLLRGEVDGLSEKMSRQLSLTGSERQMSRIKQDVIREIEKVKSMLHNQSRDTRRRESHLSPRLDEELWSVKENLTDNLEHIRRELSLMNKRIDRMESGLASEPTVAQHIVDPFSRSLNSSQFQRTPVQHQPSYTAALDSGLGAQQLRSTVNLLNTKLDSFERKMDGVSSQPNPAMYSPLKAGLPYFPVSPPTQPFLQPSVYEDDVDDLSSLSGLSDLSNLSDNDDGGVNGGGLDDDGDETDDIDEEIEAIIKRASNRTKDKKIYYEEPAQSSLYKAKSWKKGKVEFDLSDLDLSDVEAADMDSDGLDL